MRCLSPQIYVLAQFGLGLPLSPSLPSSTRPSHCPSFIVASVSHFVGVVEVVVVVMVPMEKVDEPVVYRLTWLYCYFSL